MSPHIGESAELYALGVLDASERQAIEAHVQTCDACARTLGEAEACVASLDAAVLPRREPPERLLGRLIASSEIAEPAVVPEIAGQVVAPEVAPMKESTSSGGGVRGSRGLGRFASWVAVAAAVCGVVFGVSSMRYITGVRSVLAREELALATIARSHFGHASFFGKTADAPRAKVLYAMDGHWLYLILDHADCACRLVVFTSSGRKDGGVPLSDGTISTLFLEPMEKPILLELVRSGDGMTLASVTMTYGASIHSR